MKKLILCSCILIAPLTYAKSFYEDLSLGMGMTDNANFESEDKDSDTYWLMQSSSTYITKQSDWNLWLSYKDYKTQTTNNSLSWSLSLYTPGKVIKGSSGSWNIAIGGLKYTKVEPASTEDGFDYKNVEVTYSNQFKTDEGNKANVDTRYTAQKYTSDRLDHILDLHAAVAKKYGRDHTFTPYIDLAFTYSSETLYTKYLYQLGFKWDWALSKTLNIQSYASYSVSTYINRTVSSETEVSKKKGKGSSSTQEEKEKQTNSELGVELSNKFDLFSLHVSTGYSKQSSNSGNETYNELASKAYLSFSF